MNLKFRQRAGPTTRLISARFFLLPVAKLSRPTTFWPSRSSVSTILEPMNPAAPVTSQVPGAFNRQALSFSYAVMALVGPGVYRLGSGVWGVASGLWGLGSGDL